MNSDPGDPQLEECGHTQCESLVSALANEVARIDRIAKDPNLWSATNHESLLTELLTRLSQALDDHQVEFRNHTGDPWIDGLPLTVVHMREGASDPVIVETIRPSIAMQGRVIAHGYVVIGDKSELEQTK
jgi:hypothetical protein